MCGAPGANHLDSCSSFYCGPNNPVRWESLSPPLLVHPQCLVSAVSAEHGGSLATPPGGETLARVRREGHVVWDKDGEE